MFLSLSINAQRKYKGEYGMEHLLMRPTAPDYTQDKYWIALPYIQDMADAVPGRGELVDGQNDAKADVFFIYPTIYTKKQYEDHPWFADVNDEKLNKKIANSTIKYQATVFNGSAKVYAPLYRQAHIGIYYGDEGLKEKALEIAYEDIRVAFMYYLKHWNKGRPIIIGSHSQGTNHATMLLKEFFEDDQNLKKRLVAAYIVGMPVDKNIFENIPPCQKENDTECWLTWNTYAQSYYPPRHDFWYGNASNMNPLSWSLDTAYVSAEMNKGGILKNFKKIRPGLSDAQNHAGMLWINKPQFFGNFMISWDRYHIIDYNLFYLNIRENVADRLAAYLDQD